MNLVISISRSVEKFFNNYFSTLFFSLLIFTVCSETVNGANFRAAVVKIDITPDNSQIMRGYGPRKSTGVHDRLYHRIVALDDGNTQFILISTDICLISPADYDRVAAQLQREQGINPLHLWWTTTHTHSAPEVGSAGLGVVFLPDRVHDEMDPEYSKMVEKKLMEGINEVRQKLAPARLGVGWGHSMANINRRARDVDGTVSLGLNPDGAVDRKIGLMRIDHEDGKPMALIANYPIHGTVLGGSSLVISGDAPGVVSEYVEEETGAPLLFINGAAGNLAPIYSVYPDPKSGHLMQFRVLLGDKILEANKKIAATTNEVNLTAGSLLVETPRKADLEWPQDMAQYTRTTKAGAHMVRLPVRFLKINDEVAIWAAPLELFCEVANEVRDHSPFPYTFYYGYNNGWFGYLMTEAEYEQGGYELRVSPFTPSAANDLSEAVINYLQGEMRSKPAPKKRVGGN
ncbi:neutral/alkaline non-lysosomal ceramidase N-terminal domain-containing protein [soil metagenome]